MQDNGNFQKTIRTKPQQPQGYKGKPAPTGKQWKRTNKRDQFTN